MSVPTAPDDIDEIAVERAANGDLSIHLNRAELAAAWRVLERRGHSSYRISKTLGVTDRTVQRWRASQATPISRPPGGRAGQSAGRTGPLTCPVCREPLAAHLARHMRRRHPEQQAA